MSWPHRPVRHESDGEYSRSSNPVPKILGVLALNDPDDTVTEDNLFALRYGTTVLALELSHQRTVAEIELNLRRDLVDDLLAGTDRGRGLRSCRRPGP